MIVAPASRARSRRIGSRLGWFRNNRRQGLTASTPSFRFAMMSASLRPARQSIAMTAPSGAKSRADCSRMRLSIPTERNISSVRIWKNAARGSGELARRRSMVTERIPCCARNVAADRPTNPPPAIRTGASSVMAVSLLRMDDSMQVRSALPRAPALVIGLARRPRVRGRGDLHPHLELAVRLDGGLAGPAVLFAPDECQNVPDLDVRVDDTERQRRALVVAVAAEHGEADRLATRHDLVERGRGIVAVREIEVLVVLPARDQERGKDLQHVLGIPGQGHLLAVRRFRYLLQRLPPDEVVVELDERPVAQRVGREVIVLDIPGHEAAPDRSGAFVSVRGKPLAVLLHPLPGVHRR